MTFKFDMVYWHCLKFILSRLLSVHMPHLKIFNFCLMPIPQLSGNSNGFRNSVEHNVVSGRCILRLYKMFTVSTETHIDHLNGRHDFVISLTSCSMFNSQCHRSPA